MKALLAILSVLVCQACATDGTALKSMQASYVEENRHLCSEITGSRISRCVSINATGDAGLSYPVKILTTSAEVTRALGN